MTAARSIARGDLWRIGEPWRYLLDQNQRDWRQRFWSHRAKAGDILSHVWLIARQVGKSAGFLVLGRERMFRGSDDGRPVVVRYCAKTKDSAWGIIKPNLEWMEVDCPPSHRLRPGDKDGELVCPITRASLYVFGTDAQSFERGRGPYTHLLGFDECGFYQDLDGVERALLPSLQTTSGDVLYLSTPSESPAHPYKLRCDAASASGRLEHATVFDNPRVDVEAIIRGECERLGYTREQLLASTYWRREYLAEWVTEESRAAVPSWNAQLQKELVGEWQRPPHFTGYVASDWGGYSGDPHAALFAHHDFTTGCIVIEDELELRGVDTAQLVAAKKQKERELWGVNLWDGTLLGAEEFDRLTKGLPEFLKKSISQRAPTQPYLRVCDWDEQLQGDLMRLHGYAMLPTAKHEKALLVDEVAQLFRQKRIRIHSRCRRLIEQLHSTVWNKTRSGWERNAKDHGDLIDCLCYLVRNVSWHRDPRPVQVDPWTHEAQKSSLASELLKLRPQRHSRWR